MKEPSEEAIDDGQDTPSPRVRGVGGEGKPT